MRNFKKIIRLLGLMLFLLLAVGGMSITGVAPTLSKDGKLFSEKIEMVEEKADEQLDGEELKF